MRMKFNNQRVYRKYQLETKEKEDFLKSLWNDDINDFGQLSILNNQHQNTAIWPTVLLS